MPDTVVAVEIDAGNCDVTFLPINRRLRGRFDIMSAKEPAARLLDWPAIPGQYIELNAETGAAAIVEPLHEERFASLRRKVEQRGWTVPPAREPIQNVDLATMVYWLRRAVEDGHARLLRGQMPTEVKGKPRMRFFSVESSDPQQEKIDKLMDTVDKLVTCLRLALPAMDKKRAAEVEKMLGEPKT